MISTVEVPHLKAGQKIKDYKRLYKAATAGYKAGEKLACLPIYIHRNAGETEVAYQAAEKNSLEEAFKFIEGIIDGPPCEFQETEEFFNMKPKEGSIEAIRSYFFEMYEVSKRAKIPTDVFLKRFLSQVPAEKQLYDSNKSKIRAGLDNESVIAIFYDIMENFKRS